MTGRKGSKGEGKAQKRSAAQGNKKSGSAPPRKRGKSEDGDAKMAAATGKAKADLQGSESGGGGEKGPDQFDAQAFFHDNAETCCQCRGLQRGCGPSVC